LSVIKSWEIATKMKKRGRKRYYSNTDTDDGITPAKTPRVPDARYGKDTAGRKRSQGKA
jgi:hypothetical protein